MLVLTRLGCGCVLVHKFHYVSSAAKDEWEFGGARKLVASAGCQHPCAAACKFQSLYN